ncbi:MAG: energy transducer TonB [bacterium]
MDEKNRFKLALLISCVVHFSLILLFPTLGAPLKPLPKYVEVSLVRVRPKPTPKRVVKVTTTKKKAKVEEKKVARVEEKKKIAKVVKVEKKTVGEKAAGLKEKGGKPVGGKVAAAPPKETRLAAEVSPVKISAQPGPKLPTLPPQVRTESEIKVPLIGRSVEPTLGTGTSEYALQGERAIRPEERPLTGGGKGVSGKEVLPRGSGLPSKVPSSIGGIGGGISYQPGEGEGVGGGRGRGIRGPLGEAGREIERKPEPPYPEWAQRQGKTGVVEVKCWVLPGGEVRNVEVYLSSGLPRLDEHASQYLMMWKFEPIQEEKIQWGIVPFHFEFAKK